MNDECVFCKIIKKQIPTEFLYESENLLVFKDIHPSAPIHYLIVPKEHFSSIEDTPDNIWIEFKEIALEIKQKEGHKGFRLGNNFGSAAFVKHMHVHYLSGIKKSRKI